ncbi:hypothetical protein DNTS_004659 [Danionella cerebrum]|uniref:PDZ domain-containing protein n=1 Tax=Danionella cerebrum TaxID=2873325 RepID=A0A553QYU0_9TELE|nr:hypothetical protein DNTS_004659 [Danionella translucida]
MDSPSQASCVVEDGGKVSLLQHPLQAGDEVVEINEVELSGWRQEAISLVKGSYKTLRLTVRSDSTVKLGLEKEDVDLHTSPEVNRQRERKHKGELNTVHRHTFSKSSFKEKSNLASATVAVWPMTSSTSHLGRVTQERTWDCVSKEVLAHVEVMVCSNAAAFR